MNLCCCSFVAVVVVNPTIDVVTFRLHDWDMMEEFLLLAFTSLGQECQNLLSLCDGMHACIN